MSTLRLLCLVLLILSVVDVVRAQEGERGVFQAGAAVVDISPVTLPALRNGGFLQASSDRVDDPLYARCLVLSDGRETLAMVIVDSCMFPGTLCDEIKKLASEATGLATDRMLISATHTHSAPAAEAFCLGCRQDDAYVKYVPARVAQAIADAHANLQPAKAGWAVVDGSEFTNCRRWITRSDRMGTDPFGERTVRAMMHPGYQNPDYVSPAGPVDPSLSVLSVVSAKDETPLCVMANLSMHYFGAGAGFSADYFGEVARLVESRIGTIRGRPATECVGIMSQGTSGDLHWMDYSKPSRGISRQQYSEGVAARVLEACQTIRHRSDINLAMAETRLTIGLRTPSPERLAWARPINEARGDVPPRNQVEVYAEQAEWIDQNPTAEIVLQAVRIGELGVTAIPNEVYGITGLKLKRQSPLATTFNLELANGGAGYIPPPEQHRLGGYTTWPARSAGLDEQAEPLIVETLLQLLESVAGQDRKELPGPDSKYSQAVIDKKPAAYWPLSDMTSTQVIDAVGGQHAEYDGGVALFLPGPDSPGFQSSGDGQRAVYLAGGHIAGSVRGLTDDYTITMWFWNGLPADARDVTGTLLSAGGETLLIGGRAHFFQAGRLSLRSRSQLTFGRTPIATKAWHHVTVTRAGQRVRVYLDGRADPEIDVAIGQPAPVANVLIGNDGNSATTFDGKISEVAVFDRALADSDIVELYGISGMTPPPQPKPTLVLGPKPSDAASRQKYADALMASKPVAWWRLRDDAGGVAKDQTGRSHAAYEAGSAPLKADAVRPNFSGGRVKADVEQIENTYSVELWVRNELPNDARLVTGYLFSRGIDGADGAPGDHLGIGGTHSNSGRLFVFNGNQRDQTVVGSTLIRPGSWSHVVMVRQDERITVYLNGDPKPEIEGELPLTYPASCESMFVGGRNDNFANLQGMLEEAAIYDRALTPAEVTAHFNAADVHQIEEASAAHAAPPDKPVPTEVAEALQSIHVPDGFQVQLVAAEPLVIDPVAIDWGPDGKLWVVEMADYPLGIDGNGKPGGRVRVLEDTTGDGQYDTATLFAEDLSFPNGVLSWGNGILVTAAPEIVYLEDRTGDGKADVRRVLYSGFLEGNQQLRVNGLRWGLDNWVYCASGSHHSGYGAESRIISRLTGNEHQVGSRDFRIRPDTGELDPQSGPSQFGRNRDDWGNWFGVQNSHPLWHYVLEDHNIRRNPHFAPPDPKWQVVTPTNPKVYPASKLQKRFHSFNESGRFTSACSAMIYRDELLFERGEEQHAFTCEPFHNLVQHNIITDDGVSFRFRRDPAEARTDFFASEDRWCRPVMVRTGPDGALWVVDMYRYMIEHPQWLPENGREELRPWYRSGDDRGRIYRVVRSDRPARLIPKLSELSAAELVALLESPNGWQRDTVQRLLVRTQAADAIVPLQKMLMDSAQPLARLHALATLDGLNALTAGILIKSLADPHPGVRRNATRLAARFPVPAERLAQMTDDPDAKVRLELASTLGFHEDDPAASIALAELAMRSTDDPYITAAVISSLNPRNVAAVLVAVAESSGDRKQPLLQELIGQAVAMGDARTIGQCVEIACSSNAEGTEVRRFDTLAGTLDALSKRDWSTERLGAADQQRIADTIEMARGVAASEAASEHLRAASIQLLAREAHHLADDFALMQQLLVPQTPVVVQSAVVTRLAQQSEPAAAGILLHGWRSHSPSLRDDILNVLASRRAWAETLRQHLESGTVVVAELSAPIRQQLLAASENAAEWQKALATRTSADRAEVLRQFQPALQLEGDSQHGAVLFRKLCINCHKVEGEGHEVGPTLASVTNKTPESLLTSMLDPNAVVEAKYFSYVVVTNEGRTVTGILATETGSSITLLAAEGKRQTILRGDIDELRASTTSFMPVGLEKGLSAQDLADVIQFIRAGSP